MRLTWVLLVVFACACDKDKAAPGSGSGSASGSAVVAPIAGSAVATPTPAPPKDWKVGDIVQVQSPKDKFWYEAQIVNAGATYKVLYTYADTVEDNVDKVRMRAEVWRKNNKVEVQIGGVWKPGAVAELHADGSYDITTSDGETKGIAPANVRGLRKPKQSGGGHSTAGDGPCPGPGITRRCGGVCVNLQEDSNNCGECGHHCNSGYHCDGHLFCRDANGNL